MSFLDDLGKALGSAAKAGGKAGGAAAPAARSTTRPSPLLQAFDRVKPAVPEPNKAEREWAEIKKRQDANAAGNVDAMPDPDQAFKDNNTPRAVLEKQEAAKAKAQAAADRGKREASLEVETGAKTDLKRDKVKTEEMTDTEYEALSSRQRAAVDFNTLLSDAVKHDLSRQDEYKDLGDDPEYKIRSEELFGKDRGSDMFAPETLAVLSKLKIKDSTADLDDYLGLKVAITEDEISSIDDSFTSQRGAIVNEADRSRTDIIGQYTSNTEKMRDSLAKGTQLLQSISASAQADRSFLEDVNQLGGEAVRPKTQLGYGKSELDSTFQSYFEALSNKEYETLKSADGTYGTPDNILADAKTNLDPDAYKSFLDYAEVRSRNSGDFDVKLGETKGAKYRSPEEFRKVLGMEN